MTALTESLHAKLRQYARTNPDEVRHYVAVTASRLSGPGYREALRYAGARA
jgi:hypothetical protein